MKFTAKVGTLLGKRQKTDVPAFGEPLDLGHIAIMNDTSNSNPSSDDSTTHQDTLDADSASKRSSILDLDFMAAPLAEIELVQKREQEHGEATDSSEVTNNEASDKKLTPEEPTLQETSDVSVTETLQSMPAPKPLSSLPIVDIPASPYGQPVEESLAAQSGLASKIDTDTAARNAELAIAQSMRGDTDIGFIVFGPDGKSVDRAESFPRIIGMTASQASSLNSYDQLLAFMGAHADLGDKDVAALSRSESAKMKAQLQKGEQKSFGWTTTMRTGKVLEFSNKYTANNHLVTTVRDVTEDVEKSRLLRVGLALGTAGYWSYSFTTGKSTLSEYITQKLSKAENENVETKGLISLIHPEDVAHVQANLNAAIKNRSRMDCEFRLSLENNNILSMRMIGEVELSKSTQEPEVFVAFLNDLTKDKHRLKQLNEVTELSNNRREFLARMSHEIRTPLNAIVGMTDVLRDEVNNDEALETASFIADAAENLENILSQTLEHERLSSSEIVLEEEALNLAEVARSSVAMWKKSCAEKNIRLDLRVSPDLPENIRLDKSRIRQCLTNILSNAVKFTSQGRIVLALAPIEREGQSPKLLIAVKDTGIGMDKNALANVFKPFQQGNTSIHRRFGGSGLGMSITRQIIEAMNGDIKVQSVEGEGTTIAITLPLKTEEKAQAQTKVEMKPAEPLPTTSTETLGVETFHKEASSRDKDDTIESAKPDAAVRKNVPIVPSDYSGFDVLVVEDNPINQAVVRKLLTNHINSMSFAFHGQEALEILETKSFDIILMDIHMPVKDGIETTLEIRNSGKAWADTVIVALTADPDYQQQRVCRNIGMNDALSKPVKRQELLDILQKVLNERLQNVSPEKLAG